MGMFGNRNYNPLWESYLPTQGGGLPMAGPQAPQMAPPSQSPMAPPQKRGMFGRMFDHVRNNIGYADQTGMTPEQIAGQIDKRDLFQSRLTDLGNILGGDPVSAEKEYRARHLAAQEKAKQDAAIQRLLPQMMPTKASPMGPTMSGDPKGNPARSPTMQDIMPALMEAQAAGVDVRPYMGMIEAMQPEKSQVYNAGDGYLGIVDPGKDPRFIGSPAAELNRAYKQAQIDDEEASARTRGAQGSYYEARAKQPYAPRAPAKRGAAQMSITELKALVGAK